MLIIWLNKLITLWPWPPRRNSMLFRILLTWDAETGIEFDDLLRALLAQDGRAGYLNLITINQGVHLVWSNQWISQTNASLLIKEYLKPKD